MGEQQFRRLWGVTMRIVLLVMFEIAALIGIPRMINELREAFGDTPPPIAVVAISPKVRLTAAVPAKPVLADEAATARLLKDSLPPSARTVADLQAAPVAPIPVRVESPQENPAASRDDDYLPPWMRGGGAPKREAKLAPAPVPFASAAGTSAARAVRPVRHVRHKRRRSERGWETRVRHSRRARGGGLFWAGF